ncbi:hypothetical protein [Empedobacter falsenii]|uniref:Uncharacterized protein n=1 Tax=Empedobacter falsenii TaxID=343874 RepID=A0A427BKL5_9FLAO|nr:hypothetical protein [Empedobacter falsenii]RRT90085.1 hypothetical protein EGI89_10120 [Empedobacter falsenii]RRT90138.1 hypothetical protein EGI88_10080 [Empedobacter falsenii]
MKIVNVKAYLNDRLKPKNYLGANYYPVYFRFNYKGSNHQISSNSIPYLKSENELNEYKESIEEEIFHINNFIKINNGDFDIKKFNDYYYSNVLKLIGCIIDYFKNEKSEFFKLYYKLLQDYISEKTTLDNEFLDLLLNQNFIAYTSNLPDFFIDQSNKEFTKLLTEIKTYNFINNYSKNINRDINLYDWNKRSLKEKLYESHKSYANLIDICIKESIDK